MSYYTSFTGFSQYMCCVVEISGRICIVCLEAMALGKPFVTTPVAGASEELANNQTRGLVAGWDVDRNSHSRMKRTALPIWKTVFVRDTGLKLTLLLSVFWLYPVNLLLLTSIKSILTVNLKSWLMSI
jgi:hypothetical protein